MRYRTTATVGRPDGQVDVGPRRSAGTTGYTDGYMTRFSYEIGSGLRRIRESRAYPAKRHALAFVLLCVTRAREATAARWGEFDMDKRVWVIPAERMKGGREHRVPLSDAAMKILWQQWQAALSKRRGAFEPKPDEPVFPNSNGNRPVLPDVLLPLIRDAAGDPDATVHGLSPNPPMDGVRTAEGG